MPTYVYRNLKTDQIFEIKQSMKDDALTSHPETGDPVKRLVSAPAIAFKGSGFYANDSRASSKASKPSSAADSGKTEGSKSTDSGSSSESAASAPPKTEAPKAAESSAAKSTAAAGTSGQSGGSGQ